MSALEKLSEEEAYLWAILADQTGVDQAEFLWVDEDRPDRCFRLWDFQWPFLQSTEKYQVDLLARGLGKSISITMAALAFPFDNPAQDFLITAPQMKHLKLITDTIEQMMSHSRIYRDMLPKGRQGGIVKAPSFQMNFVNYASIITRLPGVDGKGLKGPHPIRIEIDEGQDVTEAAYMEIIETIKVNAENARWRVHGVSNGTRDMHYKLTHGQGTDLPFYVHRYMAMHRPDWNDEERRNKIAIYGGTEDHPDYVRNVYGEPSDLGNPIFVTARLLAIASIAQTPADEEYNRELYTRMDISQELIDAHGDFHPLMEWNYAHLDDKYTSYWAGMDVGFTNDPSEILVFGSEKGFDRLLLRIHMERVTAPYQEQIIREVFKFYGTRLRRFGMDKTGNGLPLWHYLKDHPDIAERIAGYNFGSKVAVEMEDRELEWDEKPEDLAIYKWAKDHATDLLRRVVDTKAIRLPFDNDLLTEWQGQSVTTVRVATSQDGTIRQYSGGECHTLDAGRMYILAKGLMGIEMRLAKPKNSEPVLDLFY